MPEAAAPKRYAVTLDPTAAGKGMKLVSLVKTPAIGTGWVALAKATAPTRRVHLSEASQGAAKQVLTGPLLIPGLDILRVDEKNEEFYINFSAEQIEVIAHRFMQEGTGLTLSNAQHAEELTGNTIRELWLTASETADKAAHLGIEVPAGTLMASMHIADADFWTNEVLTGNVTGFSIEGLFDFSELQLSAVKAAPKKPMSFLTKLKALFGALALAAVELKDGTALEVDDATGEVFTLAEDGSRGPAQADGEYELADGTAFVVKEGKHVGHKAAAPADEAKTEMADDAPAADAGDADKRLSALETSVAEIQKSVAEVLKIAKKDAADGTKADDAGDTKLSAAARARAEKDPVKLASIELALEAVEMADGTSFSYNPITRRLLDSTGKMVESGQYACADGSYFKVNTEQYTYQIDKESYDKGVQLSAATAEVTRLSATVPAGQRVKMGAAPVAGEQALELAEMSPAKRRLYLAKQSAKDAKN